nr:MAG TPA: Single strand annealing-weakened 1 [Caudoviricetes sp.]
MSRVYIKQKKWEPTYVVLPLRIFVDKTMVLQGGCL